MSPTLAVSLNVLADLGLLALLTFVMSQARRLTPHEAQPQLGRRAERTRNRQVAGVTSVPTPVRLLAN